MATNRHPRLVLLNTLVWLILTVRCTHSNTQPLTNRGPIPFPVPDRPSTSTFTFGPTPGRDSPYSPYSRPRPGSSPTAGWDIEQALNCRSIHGILAFAAMLVLFPVGSVLLRLVPGRAGVLAHAVVQGVGWAVFLAAVGLGVWLLVVVRVPGGGLLQEPSTRYHPIIGIVLLALFLVQPVVGFVHHKVYKKVQKRQGWSYAHLVIGRVGITLGIVNGGLGLYVADASAYYIRVYGIVAAVMWTLWLAVAIWAEIKKARGRQAKHTAVVKMHAAHEGAS